MKYTLVLDDLSESELRWLEGMIPACINEQEGNNDAKNWLLNPPNDRLFSKVEEALHEARQNPSPD